MVTMLCCGKKFADVQASIDGHPTDATTCAESNTETTDDMTDADLTVDLDELSRADVGGDAWVDEIMSLVMAEDWS